MSNPFSGIITAAMKTQYNQMIDEMVSSSGCAIPCQLTFGGQKFIDCANCQGGIHVPNGPIPFPNGKVCPMCQGRGKLEVEVTENVSMCVFFNSKNWTILRGDMFDSPKVMNMYAETMSPITLYPKLKAAKHVVLDSDNSTYSRNVYKRYGEPEPCGFGDMRYIITAWERVK